MSALIRVLQAMVGEDGTQRVWPRLSPTSREVMCLAWAEARELGHPCLADEHLVLALLRHRDNDAAALLLAQGLELAAAREALARAGPSLRPGSDPGEALRVVGIDVEQVRDRLVEVFGAVAVRTAERRVRRRPRWRGGHPGPDPLCRYLLAKRALQLAAHYAQRRGNPEIAPRHLLYGVLQDASDPLGTQLSRRTRQRLMALGFEPGRPHPVRVQLQRCGLDIGRLLTTLERSL